MTMILRLFLIATLCLAGCADPNLGPVPFHLADTKDGIAVAGNLRLVTAHDRPIDGRAAPLPTICSEANPDAIVAFGRSGNGSFGVTEPSGPQVTGAAAFASTETATDLTGRTAGVLALRDGLSAACQAYTNGVIGQNAYALILSQYGNLLVALAGTGTAGSAPPRFTAQESAITALLVACISEHDPTRLGAPVPNTLLSSANCTKLMNAIVAGKLLKPAPDKGDAAKKAAATPTGVNITVNEAKST